MVFGAAPAVARGDVLDAIVEHEGAVIARLRAPDQNAVVARIADAIAADDHAAGVEREDGGPRGAADRIAGDLAFDALEGDAVTAGADDLAVLDPDAAAADEVDQTAARERPRPPVEHHAGQRHMIGSL